MPYSPQHLAQAPSRDTVDTWQAATMIEFGAPWCAHCLKAQPLLEQALQAHPGVTHIKVEDGKGQPLGRSFGVKLWPTLIFWRHGQEQTRLVRPESAQAIAESLQALQAE